MSCDNVGGTRPFRNILPFSESIYVQISRNYDSRMGKYSKHSFHVCAYERMEKQEGEVNHLRPVGHADVYLPPRATIETFFERVNQAVADMRRKKGGA